MPELDFAVESAAGEPHAAAPLMLLRLRVADRDVRPRPIHSIMLQCQVRIEPSQRRYGLPEQDHLQELFGAPQHWPRQLGSLLWAHTQVLIPAFTKSTTVNLPVPCSFDLTLGVTKYFDGLDEGEVPLLLLFSGTVFYAAEDAPLQAAPIGWDREATFRLPIRAWKELMQRYYPNSAWLSLRRDVVDRLRHYKLERGLLTWEQALERLLDAEAAQPGVPA